METRMHIDYLSISTPSSSLALRPEDETTGHQYDSMCAKSLLGEYPSFVHHSWNGVKTELQGDIGFTRRTFFSEYGWMLFGGANHGRILVQLAGEACHALRQETDAEGESKGLKPLLLREASRFTRIDIAADFKTEDSVDFIASQFSKMSPLDYDRDASETGVTQYLGGKKSLKRAAIYRYKPPHPRHEWTRIEMRFYGELAENAKAQILDKGILPVWRSAVLDWGFSLNTYINALGVGAEQARVAYAKRQKAGSLRWLYKVAIPALKSALDTGVVTLADVHSLLGIETPE